MSIRFLKLSLASPESIRSWTERILPNGKRVGKILKGDLIDYKNGLPIRDGLSCERIFGPMVSFTCTCGRFKCIETRGIHIVHDTLRSSRPILSDVSRQSGGGPKVKQWDQFQSSFQTSANSTMLERETPVNPIVSQNTISKPIQKLVYNEKPGKKLNSTEPLESSILQPIAESGFRNDRLFSIDNQFLNGIRENKRFISKPAKHDQRGSAHADMNHLFSAPVFSNRENMGASLFLNRNASRQKKMIRFLSDFFYDYQFIYHSNKNEIVPSFVSILEEPHNITLTTKNGFKPQTSWYYLQKRPIYEWFNCLSPIESINSKIYWRGDTVKTNLELKTRFSRVQNLLKPLYKFIFKIYLGFWFDLKVDYNNFIYEKHIFLWVPNRRFRTLKKDDNFRIHPSFSSKLKIRGLCNKSQKLPIISGILSHQKTFLNSNFFFKGIKTQKILNNWYDPSIISNISARAEPRYLESFLKGPKYLSLKNFSSSQLLQYSSDKIQKPFTFKIKHASEKQNTLFSFGWLSMANSFKKCKSLSKICIYWSQRNQRIELPYVFQFSMKLKFKKTKTEQHGSARADLFKHLQIITLYFAKQIKTFHKGVFFEKNTINSINQKFGLGTGLFEKKNLSTKNIPDEISLLIKRSIFFNDSSYGKISNISFGSLKISKFDLKQGLSNPFQKVLSARAVPRSLKKNRNSQSKAWTLFQSDKDKEFLKPVSIFDFFKKQRGSNAEKIKTVLLRSNNQSLSSRVFPFYNSDQEQSVSSLGTSWYQSPEIQEGFSPKDQTEIVQLDSASNTHGEDVSKSYVNSNAKQNIRVYKFKNFPPEEIRYCPYCEVELLPNSIRRYRLGYIEFVSPVTHIWYTANSIPLLLNLSKTMIEGIASCHEALSSGFPPVYKWSYNGESPTSWTFQIQPLKLPVNGVPKIAPINEISDHYIGKKFDSTEIIFGSKSTSCANYKQPFQLWTPSFRILPCELSSARFLQSENNFIIYQKRIKTPFIKNTNTNHKEKTNQPKKKELLYNNSYVFSPQSNTALKETLTCQLMKYGVDFPYLFWNDISDKFKCLWMFEYPLNKSLPKNSRFSPISSKVLQMVPDSLEKQRSSERAEEINRLHAKQDFKTLPFNDNLSNILNSQNSDNHTFLNKKKLAKQFFFICLLKNNYFNYFFSIAKRSLSYDSYILNFPTKSFFDNEKMNYFAPYQKKLKITRNNQQASAHTGPGSFFHNKNKDASVFSRIENTNAKNKRLKSLSVFDNLRGYTRADINRLFSRFLFKESKQESTSHFLFFKNKDWYGANSKFENTDTKPVFFTPPFLVELASVFNISDETMREFSFFNEIPKEVDSNYDLYTATEYEKKREWLKLEGFFEDPSNQKLPNDSQVNSKVQSKDQEENFSNQKHRESGNENEENDSQSFDNLSLPLVLPFLGKNPDNIEFQSNYSNHENFPIDPLKFIIDLFSTQPKWDYTDFDLDYNQNFHKLETNQSGSARADNNVEVFVDKQQYNDIWNNVSMTYNDSITRFNNKYMPSVLYSDQTLPKKNNLIKRSYSLNKFEWDFSQFSPNQSSQKTGFWPSLNLFYMISNDLFSKTCPFLPIGPENRELEDFLKPFLNPFQNMDTENCRDLKNDSFPLHQWDPNQVDTELWSNESNFTNYRKNYQNCFRKLGRNAYYFKLEQMTRLENAFLKNLFYRNKFQKTRVLKNNSLVLPFISTSLFHSINDNNKITLKNNKTEQVNQNFLIGKKTRFLFGFHLNVYGFNFFQPYLCAHQEPRKIKYPPSFLKTGNRFFSSIMKHEFSNLKNSLWPLKSNSKNGNQKLYINNFDKDLHKNIENLNSLWRDSKNIVQNNVLKEQKPLVINQRVRGRAKIRLKWPYKNSFKNLQHNWIPYLGWKLRKQESTPVGVSVSILYDFIISRSSSLINNRPSLKIKQIENKKPWFIDHYRFINHDDSFSMNREFLNGSRDACFSSNLKNKRSASVFSNLENIDASFFFKNKNEQGPARAYADSGSLLPFHKSKSSTTLHGPINDFRNEKSLISGRVETRRLESAQYPSTSLKNQRGSARADTLKIQTRLNFEKPYKQHFFKRIKSQSSLNKHDNVLDNFKHDYSFKAWPSLKQKINYQPNRKILFSRETIRAKQKLDSLALLGLDTTKIEFFGSLKIYAKRKFLEVWYHPSQNFKNKIPFLFNRSTDLKSKTGNALNQKCLYILLINSTFPIIGMNRSDSGFFLPFHKSKSSKAPHGPINDSCDACFSSNVRKRRLAHVWSEREFFKKKFSMYFMIKSPYTKQKQLKTSLNKGFFVWLSLQESQPKRIILPWKKLQFSIKERTLTKNKKQVSYQIIKHLSFNNSDYSNSSRLAKLRIEPQKIGNLRHLTMKRHKNIMCYAYALETTQNKKRIPHAIITSARAEPRKSIKDFKSESKRLNHIQSLSFKTSCFSYFGFSSMASLHFGNKLIIQKKSIYQPKVIVQRIPKQIPLLGCFQQTLFIGKTTDTKESREKKPVFDVKNTKGINYIQSKYDLNVRVLNPQNLKASSYTSIFKWGERGHIFDTLTGSFYKNNNYHRNQVSYPFKNPKHHHTKNTDNSGLELLFRTDANFPSVNWRRSGKLNQKILSDSGPLMNEKQKGRAWKGNTNYYACISQITSWGSDHGSWILFLKYIRANIYKGDQLLPSYFNKMNFQMMPRTGSIMLQQLLSQLVLIPKALDENHEPNFISKQKPVSEIDTWQNFATNRNKNNYKAVRQSTNKIGHNFMIREANHQFFHYNSSFFTCPTQGIVDSNKNLQATYNKFWSNHKSSIYYKTFSILDGLVFLKKNLPKTIQKVFNNTLIKGFSGFLNNVFGSHYSIIGFNRDAYFFSSNMKNKRSAYCAESNRRVWNRAESAQYASLFLKNKNERSSKPVDANTIKHSTNYTKKYALYAYKIKKPVSNKRFEQIYQLNLPKPINNWYRLNNFFSYSQSTINQVKQKNQDFTIKKENIFNISTNVAITPHYILSGSACGFTPCEAMGWDSIRHVRSRAKNKIYESYLNESIPYYVTSMNSDIRILKLIYSLIVSFQLQFLPGNGRVKQPNNRFRDNKKLFNASFSPKVYNASNKAINKYPTYKISNTYYHIYSGSIRFTPRKAMGWDPNQNNYLKHESWYPKSSILGLSSKDNSMINNGNSFDRYQNSLLQNSVWLRSYLVKSKASFRLIDGKPWVLNNNNPSSILSGSACGFTSCEAIKWDPIQHVRNRAKNKKNLTNGVFKSYSNQNYLENFYFSNQKVKVYNILISPLEVPTSRFLNFGFPTTPFDFVESGLNRSTSELSRNYKKSLESLSLKTQKWSYVRSVKHFISDIKPYNDFASNYHFNQSDDLKISSCNSQKSKFTNNKDEGMQSHENGFETPFRSVLPTNLETYKGHIQSETLFIKLKEIGNYNALMKKKDTVFKTLIIKMNSSFHPLLSTTFKANKNQIQLTKTITNFHQAPKTWNQDFIFKKENTFYNSDGYFNFDKKEQSSSLNKKKLKKNLQTERLFLKLESLLKSTRSKTYAFYPGYLRLNKNERGPAPADRQLLPLRYPEKNWLSIENLSSVIKHKSAFSPGHKWPREKASVFSFMENTNALVFSKNFKKTNPYVFKNMPFNIEAHYNFLNQNRQMFVYQKIDKQAFSVTGLEFLRIWLFLDSVHCSHLHWFNNLENKHKIDLSLINNQSVSHRTAKIREPHHNNFFPKILQFYEYRKNFLLKKIFKQRINLTQYTVQRPLTLDQEPITRFKPTTENQYQNIAFKILPTIKRSPDFFSNSRKFAYWKENSIFGQSLLSIKWLILVFSQSNKFFKSWFEVYTLLKRNINIFYDQELDLNIKYEFKPFGPQIKHSSTYSNWKNLKSFKPQISDLTNITVGALKNQIRFRLLTIPQIFDLKDQNNLLSIIRKNTIPINSLGPLVFSSSIRPSKKKTFPVLKAPENQSFWGTHTIFDYDLKKSSGNNMDLENLDNPILINSRKFELNENIRPEAPNNGYITVFNEKLKHSPIYSETFINPDRPLSSETLFREENLKVSSSYKALLRKAKILEDYPVTDPDPIDFKSICLKLLNGGLPRPIGWNFKGTVLGDKLPLFGADYRFSSPFDKSKGEINNNSDACFSSNLINKRSASVLPSRDPYNNKVFSGRKMRPNFSSHKNMEVNPISWKKSKNSTIQTSKLLSARAEPRRFIWDGNQNRFKNFIGSKSRLDDLPKIHQKTSKDVFSMRDQTKLKNETMTNLNDGTSLSVFGGNRQNHNKNTIIELKRKSGFFSKNQKISSTDQNRAEGGKRKNTFTDFVENSKSNRRNSTLNYGRNLRKLRLQYLRNFRRLRFIEYLKATYIKPEWMILSLLPVLPPDLRPVIANPRGYITGDINTHYQNVIYRNNNIEKLLDTFWIPRKFYSKTTFSNYKKATALMFSSIKSHFHSVDHFSIDKKAPLKFKNRYSILKLFSKLALFPVTFLYENEIQKITTPIKDNEWLVSFREIYSPTQERKPIKVLQSNVLKPTNTLFYKTQLAYCADLAHLQTRRLESAQYASLFFKNQNANSGFSLPFKYLKGNINNNRKTLVSQLLEKQGFSASLFSNKFENMDASVLKKMPFNIEALKYNELVKGPFSFLINRLLFLNSIKFNNILQNNFSLNVNNEMGIGKNLLLTHVKKPFLNPFKNNETSAALHAPIINWQLERLISPMFSKFTTFYFDTPPFYELYRGVRSHTNKRENNYNDKLLPRDKFFRPWVSFNQEEGFFESKIQNTIQSIFKNTHKASAHKGPRSFLQNKNKDAEKCLSLDKHFHAERLFRKSDEKQASRFPFKNWQYFENESPVLKEKSAIIINNEPLQQDFIENEHNNFYKTSDLSVPKKIVDFKLGNKNNWFHDINQSTITEDFQRYKKPAYFELDKSLPYNILYKPLLKLYNHKSFFGSNIGIATGYNEIVQAFRFKKLSDESAFDRNAKISIKDHPVPTLETKLIRTQALHDSKPLQEMQYSLQKAVDALIDNSQKLQSNILLRKGRPLKSLSDNLKGKEGRFRQHLLGKRVDYSGRSVIVVGPDLKLYECGIPLIMALRLFQPFLILYLIYRFKIASLLATQLIQRKHPMVINLLKKFIETWPILLNRAPTLHRMNIQAFKIRLVQGKAILLHPLVCSSYNADFDGDQMGVHVPITQQARAESWKLLWSINNSIAIASRQPLFLPSQDMVIGNYYLTAPPIDNSLADFRFINNGSFSRNRQLLNDSRHDKQLILARAESGQSSKWDQNLNRFSSASLMQKKQWPLNLNIHDETQSYEDSNSDKGSMLASVETQKKPTLSRESAAWYPFSQEWFDHIQKMSHYFFSLEEAYQYYLNTAYRLHINTPVWFRFCMVFETSEHVKPIEITIDKHGNTIYTTKYYEKQLKKNRILGKNAFYFSTHLDSLITQPLWKQKSIKTRFENPIQKIGKASRFKNKDAYSAELEPFRMGQIDSAQYAERLFLKLNDKQPSQLAFKNWQYFKNESPVFKRKSTIILPSQVIFNKNLRPILLNQLIRSTFGRIEFYYEAFNA